MAGDFALRARIDTAVGGMAGAVSSGDALPARLRGAIVEGTADVALTALQLPLRILDVGCGAGELLHEMVVRVPYGEAFVGVDADPSALAAARSIADTRMEFRLAPPESLPFDDASFDLVVAAAGVLTWRDPAAGLAELGRVVSDTGRVVVAERARAAKTVRELLGRAGLTNERDETVVRLGLPIVRAFIAFP